MRGVLLRGEHASDAAGDLLQVQVPEAMAIHSVGVHLENWALLSQVKL